MKLWKAIHGISYGRQCCQPCNQSTGQQLLKTVLPALQPIHSTSATEDSAASLAINPQYSRYGKQCCQSCNRSTVQQQRKAVLPALQPIHRTAATEDSAASLATNPQYSSYGRQCCQPCNRSTVQLRHQAAVLYKQTRCSNVRLYVNPACIFLLRVGSSAASKSMKGATNSRRTPSLTGFCSNMLLSKDGS